MRPKSKLVLILIICFLCSIFLVGVLQILSVGNNDKNNHFIRLFPPHLLGESNVLSLNGKGFYIAGITKDAVFLGNYLDPISILIVSRKLNESKNYLINIPANENSEPSLFHLTIDSPHLYLNNYATGRIFQGNLSTPFKKLVLLGTPKISTTLFLPFSGNSFAIRTYDHHLRKNVLGKISTDSPFQMFWPQLLEQQIDGVFSTDGMLGYDASSSSFVYIYFYRNQFICLDKQFQLRYKGHTLDTNTYAKIKVSTISYQNKSTISSPGFYVNRQACINKQWIIINSDMKADNEEEITFNNYSVIDMYGSKDGVYHFSFYLPKERGRIVSIAIYDNILYTIQDNTLNAFALKLNGIKL